MTERCREMTKGQAAPQTPLELVIEAAENQGRRVIGPNQSGYYSTNCPGPNHKNGDRNPSLSFWAQEDEDGKVTVCFKCWSGDCKRGEILQALRLDPRKLPSASTSYYTGRPPLTLFELTDYLLLDWEVLVLKFQVEEGRYTRHDKYGKKQPCAGLKIPYFYPDGTSARDRVRLTTDGDKRFAWLEPKYKDIIAYNLPCIKQAKELGYVVIVEGESDVWTLAHYDIPAIGIPGANTVDTTLDASLLLDIKKIYVISEDGDGAGQEFPFAVQRRLLGAGYKHRNNIICVPMMYLTGCKDPNQYHQKLYADGNGMDRPGIKAAMLETFKRGRPVGEDKGEEAEESARKLDKGLLDQAIAGKDYKAFLSFIPQIARLPRTDSMLIKAKAKEAFGKTLDAREFNFAINEERKRQSERELNKEEPKYYSTPAGMVYGEEDEGLAISNFSAEIITDITTDDGAETSRSYEISAQLSGRSFHFEVLAKEFGKCEWVDEFLGARARITTGAPMKSHLINAIKTCSEPKEVLHFAHTGWRKIDGQMVYLHNAGIISQVSHVVPSEIDNMTNSSLNFKSAQEAGSGDVNNDISQVSQVSHIYKQIRVKLTGTLAYYKFETNGLRDVRESIRGSLSYLELASDTLTFPLYSAMWRSVLGDVNFGLHLGGQSGQGKTELVSPIQQHWGSEMNANRLPGSWESTENSLEMLLFQAKDAVVVIDDFKPKGGKVDQDRLHAKADRIFRSIGNGSGRGRLDSNLSQRVERRPRCLVISTGEDMPRGQSLKARSIVLSMDESITQGAASQRLLAVQKLGRQGVFAHAMASYLEWLAPKFEGIQEALVELVITEREALRVDGHSRSGTNTANMVIGMKFFLNYAVEVGAITHQEATAYLDRCITALKSIAVEASHQNKSEKPSEQWLRLIRTAIGLNKAHLVTRSTGDNPGAEYGWEKSVRTYFIGDEKHEEETWRGGGEPIGWIENGDVYLSPEAAYRAACAVGKSINDDVTTLEPTLRKFLNQDGLLASTDLGKKRPTITVRKSCEKFQRDVLHLKLSTLFPNEAPVYSDDLHDLLDLPGSEAAPEAGSLPSQVFDSSANKSSQISHVHDLKGGESPRNGSQKNSVTSLRGAPQPLGEASPKRNDKLKQTVTPNTQEQRVRL